MPLSDGRSALSDTGTSLQPQRADGAAMRRLRPHWGTHLLLAILTVAVLAALAAAAFLFMHPTVLTVAVDRGDSVHARVIAAFARRLEVERAPIRLSMVYADGLSDASAIFAGRKTDLAVVRSLEMPASAQTVAVIERDAVLFIASGRRRISKIADLKGRRLGVPAQVEAKHDMLAKILAQQNLMPDAVHTVLVPREQIGHALQTGQIDAYMLTMPLQGPALQHVIMAVRQAMHVEPVIFGVQDAEAIAQRFPVFDSYDIVVGAFGGNPRQPRDDITTLSYTHRLVAQGRLDADVVADLTRLLFTMRPALAVQVPDANSLEALDPDQAAKLDLHPGARAWYAGEQTSFMERYSDFAYLGIYLFTGVASGVGALIGYLSRRRQAAAAEFLQLADKLLREARLAESEAALRDILRQADELLSEALNKAGKGQISSEQFAMYSAVDQHINAVAQQRSLELTTGARAIRTAAPGPDTE